MQKKQFHKQNPENNFQTLMKSMYLIQILFFGDFLGAYSLGVYSLGAYSLGAYSLGAYSVHLPILGQACHSFVR